MDFEITENPTESNEDAAKRRLWRLRQITVVGAFILCLTQILGARADPASCMANIPSYVAELDALLSKEKDSLRPFIDLEERYLPFRDCEAGAFLEAIRKSSFLRSISYHFGQYFIRLENEEVRVGLTYHVAEKKSEGPHSTGWIHK